MESISWKTDVDLILRSIHTVRIICTKGTVQLDLVIFQQTSNLCSKENLCFRNTFKPDTQNLLDATKIEIFPYVHGVIHV